MSIVKCSLQPAVLESTLSHSQLTVYKLIMYNAFYELGLFFFFFVSAAMSIRLFGFVFHKGNTVFETAGLMSCVW